MSKFLSTKYKNLSPYVPGEQPKDSVYIKLNTNESPFPPSKKVVKSVKREVKKLNLYPDPECSELTIAVADSLGVKKENVLMTNGSDEILNFAFMAYCDNNIPAVFADITYGFYKVFAEINNVPIKVIPLKDDFSIDKTDYYNAGGTIFIANPNAPTGLALSIKDIRDILDNNKNNIVVIDQAYVDFSEESAVSLINEYDNLIVTETFSKSRSFAGGRLGYGVANAKIISDLNAIKYSTNPYNLDRLTIASGTAIIKDKKYFDKCVKEVVSVREELKKNLTRLGFTLTDSKANFLFIKKDGIAGEVLYSKLRKKGVLVRHFKTEKICDFIRVTVGSRKQMQTFLEKIVEVIKEQK